MRTSKGHFLLKSSDDLGRGYPRDASPIEAAAFPRRPTLGNDMQELINTKVAAPLMGVAPATLENWRVRGEGPPFHKTPGRTGKVLYDPADIAAWREQRRFVSTAEATAADA